MVSRVYLYFIFVLTILFWLLFGAIVYLTNPLKAELLVFLAFFTSLFLGLWGFFILILFYLKSRFGKKGLDLEYLKSCLRQGGLFSLFLISVLVFSAFSLLNIWTVSLAFVFIFLLELVLRMKR